MKHETFDYIVLNIPHSSAAMADALPYDDAHELAKEVRRWTDWHTDVLFKPSPELSPRVIPYVFPYSRFFIDAERLENDPLEDKGEGIVYTNFEGNCRQVTPSERERLMTIYRNYLSSISLDARTLLIDCHSFPSDLAADVDICIGFNEDDSRPSDELRQCIADTFAKAGYRTCSNAPYSNSLTPQRPIHYKSVMIEVNKAVYMDEQTLQMKPSAATLTDVLHRLYGQILSFPDRSGAAFLRDDWASLPQPCAPRED